METQRGSEKDLTVSTDQPPPLPGRTEVNPISQAEFLRRSHARYEKGLREYGTPLMTFNGRDAIADCMDELCDAWIYLSQDRLERRVLDEMLALLQEMHTISAAILKGLSEAGITITDLPQYEALSARYIELLISTQGKYT